VAQGRLASLINRILGRTPTPEYVKPRPDYACGRIVIVPRYVGNFLPFMLAERPTLPIHATVLHNREPLADGDEWWDGVMTVDYYRRRDIEIHGSSDIHGNAVCGPDGLAYNGRPLNWPYDSYGGSHIAKEWGHVPADAQQHVPPDLRQLAYPDREWLNKHAVSVAAVGRFDEEPAHPLPLSLDVAFRVLAGVHTHFGLPADRLFLHYQAAYKPRNRYCPGRGITVEWARDELASRLAPAKLQIAQTAETAAVTC